MLILDRMLIGGIRFVLDKLVTAVDQEMNDVDRMREELLAAQMQLELGEIDEARFAAIEADLVARIHAILAAREGASELAQLGSGDVKVTGIEASFVSDEEEAASTRQEAQPVPSSRPRRRRR